MRQPKIALIDHSYHKKTLSFSFLVNILGKYFNIDLYWDHSWNKGEPPDYRSIAEKKYSILVFLQVLPPPAVLRVLNPENIVIVPLFDGSRHIKDVRWLKYHRVRFLNFSKTLHEKLVGLGLESLYVQYFVPPMQTGITTGYQKPRGFFWQRTDLITWEHIKMLIPDGEFENFHIHAVPDPGAGFFQPGENDIKKYNITFSRWFESKNDFLLKMNRANIFFAPRRYEGIGISFLEAMAMGMCVAAPDEPTMNEYIRNGTNGLLYDYNDLRPLDFSNFKTIGENAFDFVKENHKKWVGAEEEIVNYIAGEKEKRVPPHPTIKERLKEKIRGIKGKKRVLIFYPHNPFQKTMGINSRFYRLLKYFHARNCIVDMLSHQNFVDVWSDTHGKSDGLLNNLYLNDYKKSKQKEEELGTALSKIKPTDFPDLAFTDLRSQFDTVLRSNKYDIILMSYVHWGRLMESRALRERTLTVLDLSDFVTVNRFESIKGNFKIGEMIEEEIRRVNLFDKVMCISIEEKSFFERFCKKPGFYYIPHMLPQNGPVRGTEKTVDILLVASDNPFNRDGAAWFFEKVYPRLKSAYKIVVIGKVTKFLDKYKKKCKNVTFLEYVENLDEYYRSSRLSMCPLLGGTGLKIKVIESLSFGVPVVTTSYGVVGMECRTNNGCLAADDPKVFSRHIEALIEDVEYREEIAVEAKNFFKNNFSEEVVFKRLDAVFEIKKELK